MTALGALIVVAIIGVITWVVIGVRQRASEPATFAGAGSFYAHIMSKEVHPPYRGLVPAG